MSDELPIKTLVSSRCRELGLGPVELVRRCGYKNISKGLWRLEQLCIGARGSPILIRALPAALDLPAEAVREAVENNQRQFQESEEAAWQAAFVPHAVILTERRIPQPMFGAAFLAIARLWRVEFDLTRR